MFARVATVAFQGIESVGVDVQVQIGPGAVQFTLVGLADKAVTESRERVRAALVASGLALPAKRVTVNLAPADLPKEGSHYDLPIALGLMAAMGVIPADVLGQYVIIGELSLNGEINAVNGALPAAIYTNSIGAGLICPSASGSEAAWADPEMDILAPVSLNQLVNHFKGEQVLTRPEAQLSPQPRFIEDLSDVKGQESAKRALEVAAAGGHNMLMVGPPGAGKSLLASRLPGILPKLLPEELLEVSMIASIAGELEEGQLSPYRPFRSPHHSASMAALVGGGIKAKPGEVSLAHHGVLFLDELPEFQPQVLDSLRQPMESGQAIIARANNRVSYPSQVQIIAAMNPCRCGYAGEPGHTCKRGTRCAQDYQARISGPFLDRIDIHIDVPAVTASDLIRSNISETSKTVSNRVQKARLIQLERYKSNRNCTTNAQCPAKDITEICALEDKAQKLFLNAAEQMHLSARSYHRILKVARTLADLDCQELIANNHIAEAINYRSSKQAVGVDVNSHSHHEVQL
ncbi:YifB family Mg chelatase-like AAA ATPase [Polycladidibacter stylochi]|uniref:YifB family Mg chelatase-like AAA ATPase n=1 Tax=Polycladidibacter stylochi TaxID=1807766 RepID=UPI000836A51F|nr:YifB family Mg chelatase-like AAA ATPase [Pseudovibrio stylochi]